MSGPGSRTGSTTGSGTGIGSVQLVGKGTGGAVHRTGCSCVGEGDAGGEGRGASGKRVHCSQPWNTGWARPKQREGGRSTCEEGEVGKEGEEKEVGGWDCRC